MKVSQVFNVGVTPSSITVYKKYGYVCNNNNYSIPDNDTVTVLDLEKGVPKLTIKDNSFNQPYRSVVYKGYLYVTNSGTTTITVIDIKTNQVIKLITGFDGPTAIVASKNKLYVSNYGCSSGVGSGNGTTISVVDITLNNIIYTITVSLAPVALKFNKSRKNLYCLNYIDGNSGTGTINIISLANNIITDTISGFSGPFDMVVSKDDHIYVTNFGSNNFSPFGTNISVVDLKTKHITQTIEIGIQPAGICLSKDERKVYVSNYNALYASPSYQNLTYGEGTISVIDRKREKLISTIKVGQTPSMLVSNEDKIYVTSYSLNIIQTINI